jgi:hypothetical protein
MRQRALEAELGRRLREAPIPRDPDAEARVLELALARQSGRRRVRHTALPRLAAALAIALVLGALLLTPAWATVRDWVGDTFESTPTRTSPTGLGPIPGGGRLLVQTPAGAWIVEPDGARHLLRGYREASWSPHGLYIAAVRDGRLDAVAPDGTRHWTVRAAGAVHDPRWSPSGELVAYRSGAGLRVVAGDGSEDRALDDSVAPVAPAWEPAGAPDLAYVDARGALRLLDVADGRAAATGGALNGIESLEWAGPTNGADEGDGALLEASSRQIRVRAVGIGVTRARLGRPRKLHIPAGEVVRDAALSPDGRTVAALVSRRDGAPGRRRLNDLLLLSTRTGSARRLGSVPGQVTEIAWSPGGGRLLVAWPSFDEWLFTPPGGGEGRAITGVAAAFRAGGGPFPSVSGWCCRARSAAAP